MPLNRDDPPRTDGTVVDSRLAPRRLKQGLVPADTGIFLRVEEGGCRGEVFVLSTGGVYIIGRDGADVVIPDEKVSRKHAELGLYGPGAFVLRDLASTNGTLLNGKRIQEKARLNNWDVIRVGDTVLRFNMVEG